jgi:hypothetical protein
MDTERLHHDEEGGAEVFPLREAGRLSAEAARTVSSLQTLRAQVQREGKMSGRKSIPVRASLAWWRATCAAVTMKMTSWEFKTGKLKLVLQTAWNTRLTRLMLRFLQGLRRWSAAARIRKFG